MQTFGVALTVAISLASAVAYADGPAPPSVENVKAAGQHFQKARELYQGGSYREAVSELEVALVLDPTAKDLVYNLGVLSEKLNRIDDSIKYFKRYVEMDVDASERAKGEAYIKRLLGAKKEVPPPPPDDPEDDRNKSHKRVIDKSPTSPPATSHGALNGVLIVGTVLGVAGISVGAIMGSKALSDKPASGSVTSTSVPYSLLASQAQSAHTEAIVSDVAFGVGIAAALTTVFLYVATRPRAPIYLSQSAPRLAPIVGANVSGVALVGSF